MDNQLFLAAQAARAARYAQPYKSGYQPVAPQPEESDSPKEIDKPQGLIDPKKILRDAGSVGASGLSAAGNALDLVGSVGRDLVTWLPGGPKPHNPFDQLLDPFGRNAHENRIEGRQILRDYGLAGKRDTWGNFATGLAFEMATDPLTYTGLGVLTKGGKALQAAGLLPDSSALLKEMAETAGYSSKKVNRSGSGKRATVGDVFTHWKDLREKTIKEATAKKLPGKRITTRNTFGSVKELEDLKDLKPNDWAVVDDKDGYKIFQWKVDEKSGAGKWIYQNEPSTAIKARMAQTVTPYTIDKSRDVFKSQMDRLYPGVDPNTVLSQPLESIISFKAPFMDRWELNLKDPAGAWKNFLEKQPNLDRTNQIPIPDDAANAATAANAAAKASGNTPPAGGQTPPAGQATQATPAGTQPAPTAQAAEVTQEAFDEFTKSGNVAPETVDNIAQKISRNEQLTPQEQAILGSKGPDIEDALGRMKAANEQPAATQEVDWDALGMRNADGTLKESRLGPEATRVMREAAQVFGKQAVDTWNIIETAAVGAARLSGVDVEDFFRDINIAKGTQAELNQLKKGLGLEQGARTQVDTPEFKNWFGDWKTDPANASKVVDKDGKPLVVYHGNAGGVDGNVFRIPEARGEFPEPGVFFTENADLASVYAHETSVARETLEKPKWVNISEKDWAEMDVQQQKLAIKKEIGPEPPRVEYADAKNINDAAEDLSGWLYREFDDIDHWESGWSRMTKGDGKSFVLETIEKIRRKYNESGYTGGISYLKKIEDAIKQSDIKYNDDTGRLTSPPSLKSLARETQESLKARDEWVSRTFNTDDLRPIQAIDTKYPSVVPAYLDIKNPYIIHYEGKPFRPATAANAIAKAKELGHDGVIIRGVRDDAKGMGNNPRFLSNQYIAFSPNQIKSATANSGKFDPANPSILAQLNSPQSVSFFSKFQEVLDSKVGGKASLEQLRATAKKAGVKDEELEDIGIEELFADGKPKTKAEIQRWVDENKVDIEVVEKRNLTPEEQEIVDMRDRVRDEFAPEQDEAYQLAAQIEDEVIDKILASSENPLRLSIGKHGYAHDPNRVFINDAEGNNIGSVLLRDNEPLSRAIHKFYKSAGWHIFERYADNLPKDLGDTFKEQSRKANEIREQANQSLQKRLDELPPDKSAEVGFPGYENYVIPGGNEGSYREMLLKLPEPRDAISMREESDALRDRLIEQGYSPGSPQWHREFESLREKARSLSGVYEGPHWNEENVIAHIRMDDITLPNGRKALRIQEVQSDWHQSGKKQGYRKALGPINRKIKEAINRGRAIEKSIEKNQEEFLRELDRLNEKHAKGELSPGDSEALRAIDEAGKKLKMELESAMDEVDSLDAQAAEIKFANANSEVPDGPFKKSWATLALKQAIKEAVEKGYDEIHIAKGSDAASAVGGPDEALGTFYDTILTGDMKKLTKKWGSFQGTGNIAGARAGLRWIDSGDSLYRMDANGGLYATVKQNADGKWSASWGIEDVGEESIGVFRSAQKAKDAGHKRLRKELEREGIPDTGFSGDVQVFEISPKMREDLLREGLPLYQKTGDTSAKGAIFFKSTETAIRLFKGGDISTLHHEFAHAMRRMLDGGILAEAEAAIAKQIGGKVTTKGGKWTREAEEVWARSWERYLKEGKSPVKGLEKAFQMMKEWLTEIYKAVTGDPVLSKKLPKETKDLFDKILKEGDDALNPPASLPKKPKGKGKTAESAGPSVVKTEKTTTQPLRWLNEAQNARRAQSLSKTLPADAPQKLNDVNEVVATLEPLRTPQDIDGIKVFAVPYHVGKKPLIVDGGGRPMILLNIDGVEVPFYQVTGDGGKSIQKGSWTPFFGYDRNSMWINKGSEDNILAYYNSPKLAKVSQYLDDLTGNITHLTKPNKRAAFSKATEEVGVMGNADFDKWINAGLTPAGSGDVDLLSKNIVSKINQLEHSKKAATTGRKPRSKKASTKTADATQEAQPSGVANMLNKARGRVRTRPEPDGSAAPIIQPDDLQLDGNLPPPRTAAEEAARVEGTLPSSPGQMMLPFDETADAGARVPPPWYTPPGAAEEFLNKARGKSRVRQEPPKAAPAATETTQAARTAEVAQDATGTKGAALNETPAAMPKPAPLNAADAQKLAEQRAKTRQREIDSMADAIDGNRAALVRLGVPDNEIDDVISNIKSKTDLQEKARVLAGALGFPFSRLPTDMMNDLEYRIGLEDAAAARKAEEAALNKLSALAEDSGINKALQDMAGEADDPLEAAKQVLREKMPHLADSPGGIDELHESLMRESDDYANAFSKLTPPPESSKIELEKAEVNAKNFLVKDPDFDTMMEDEILGPPPKLSKANATEKEIDKAERAIEQHMFRKLQYLKNRGRREEADAVARELVEKYAELPGIVAKNALRKGASRSRYDDMLSLGQIMLLNAVERFNYLDGNKFSTYGTSAIEFAYREHYRNASKDLAQQAYRRMKRAVDRFTSEGSAVTPSGIYKKHTNQLLEEVKIRLGNDHEKILELKIAGKTNQEVAEELGLSSTVVSRRLAEIKEVGDDVAEHNIRISRKPKAIADDADASVSGSATNENAGGGLRNKELKLSKAQWDRLSEELLVRGTLRQQQVLGMKLSGMSHEEIGKELGKSESAIAKDFKKIKEIASAIKSDIDDAGEEVFGQMAPKKQRMKAAREWVARNKETLTKIIENVDDEGLRGRWLNMLDMGHHFIEQSPAVLAFNRYFDKSVYGQKTYDTQQLARRRYRAVQRAIFESREILSAITKTVAQTGILDEQEITRSLIREAGLEGKEAAAQARSILNKRNSEIVRYMENAIDEAGNKGRLNREIMGGEGYAAKIEKHLQMLKDLFPGRLEAERLAGLKASSLKDIIDYFPRNMHKEYGAAKGRSLDAMGLLFDTSMDSQKKRTFRNIPGGRAVLDEISMDEGISGIYWSQKKMDKDLSTEALESAKDRLLSDKYRSRVFTDAHFDENGALTNAGHKHAATIIRAMADLPPLHSQQKIPIFGRNALHDLSKYVQDSIATEGVARAAQDIVARNVLPTGQVSEYTITKLFDKIKLDNHIAYMNVIETAGRRGEYNAWSRNHLDKIRQALKDGKKISFLKGKSRLTLTQDGKWQVVPKRKGSQPFIVTDEELAQQFNLGKKFTAHKQLSVNKEAYESATEFLRPWMNPKEIGDIQRFWMEMLHFFKTNVTIPYPAFHVRNRISGAMQNFFYDASDPSAPWYERYIRPNLQAETIRLGKTVKGLYNQLPNHIRDEVEAYRPLTSIENPTDDQLATEWIREQVFKFGITGDKQGYAAESVGESLSALVSQYPGYKEINRSFRNLGGLLREPQVGVPLKDKLNLLHTRGGVRPAIVDKPGGGKTLGVKRYEETTSSVHRMGEDLANATENLNRIAPFLAFVKQGNLPEEAARKVQRIQIDYSDLSETQKALRQVWPFFTFSSKVMHLTLGDLIRNPAGKQAWTIRGISRGQKPEDLAPEHIKRGAAIPLGATKSGADRYISGFGLPFEDPLQFAGVLQGDIGGFAGEVLSRMRPEAQAVAELATGRNIYFDRPLGDLDPPIGRTISNIGEMLGAEKKEGLAEPFLHPGVEWLVGKSPLSRLATTATKATDNRKDPLYRLANTMTGFRVTDVEPKAQERIAIDMASNLMKEYGGREFSRTYIPEWAKERLSMDRQEQVDAIQSFISEVSRRAHQRKKEAEGLAVAVSGQAGDL